MENTLVHIGVLARQLKVTSSWLRAEAEAGRLPHIKAGKTILFDAETVRKLLLERAKKGTNNE